MTNSPPVILVTGGSRGLGQSFVKDLLEHGFRVATLSRSKSPFIEEMTAKYPETHFMWEMIDATDIKKISSYIDKVTHQLGRIYGLINNAGVAADGVLTMMNDEEIDKVMSLNLDSVIKITRAVIKKMFLSKDGCIINISSIIGIRGYSGLSVYSATKAGLDGFSRALARELGARNIRVNSVAPGYLETEMSSTLGDEQRGQIIRRTPLQRLGKVEDVTGLIRFLLSDDARFITGQTIIVDGGITC